MTSEHLTEMENYIITRSMDLDTLVDDSIRYDNGNFTTSNDPQTDLDQYYQSDIIGTLHILHNTTIPKLLFVPLHD